MRLALPVSAFRFGFDPSGVAGDFAYFLLIFDPYGVDPIQLHPPLVLSKSPTLNRKK
jgi:hypothetical protein